MTGFENRVGFKVTGSKLQLVEVVYKNDQYVLENIDEAYYSEPLNLETDKETKISAMLQGAYNEMLIKKSLKSSFASFTLPFELFYTMQVPYDNTLLHQDLVEEFRWELSVLYPFAAHKDFAVEYIEVEKYNLIDYNSAIVIGLPRKYLQLIVNFCKTNNLNLQFVDNLHFASERALSLNYPLINRGIILSVYFNNKYLSVIFSVDGKPVKLKVIPLNDAGEVPSLLLAETTQSESFNINRSSISSAYITGDDITGIIIQSLNKTLGLDFIPFNPFEKLKPEPVLFDNKYFSEKFNSFSPAAGIAYRLA